MGRRLGIGFVGAGFMNRFHVASLVGVRDCEVTGVFSPTREFGSLAAQRCSPRGRVFWESGIRALATRRAAPATAGRI